jgi:hypothetical protein
MHKLEISFLSPPPILYKSVFSEGAIANKEKCTIFFSFLTSNIRGRLRLYELN